MAFIPYTLRPRAPCFICHTTSYNTAEAQTDEGEPLCNDVCARQYKYRYKWKIYEPISSPEKRPKNPRNQHSKE